MHRDKLESHEDTKTSGDCGPFHKKRSHDNGLDDKRSIERDLQGSDMEVHLYNSAAFKARTKARSRVRDKRADVL
ncbi:hypothetical protein JD844_012529 [Phrynosoma platyrhinos]|uniref:Interferon-related developmental regulator C-terminal domain-containing protein n=1 Tax=Phrynosoma platyrhinos TaxID=52577 RepID=A0ABQ7TKT2_PHRPL|nr:hypothetical protein JD844_012529 [Phrynosoma platyrhinos]